MGGGGSASRGSKCLSRSTPGVLVHEPRSAPDKKGQGDRMWGSNHSQGFQKSLIKEYALNHD